MYEVESTDLEMVSTPLKTPRTAFSLNLFWRPPSNEFSWCGRVDARQLLGPDPGAE